MEERKGLLAPPLLLRRAKEESFSICPKQGSSKEIFGRGGEEERRGRECGRSSKCIAVRSGRGGKAPTLRKVLKLFKRRESTEKTFTSVKVL